jgi:hypothetical protein
MGVTWTVAFYPFNSIYRDVCFNGDIIADIYCSFRSGLSSILAEGEGWAHPEQALQIVFSLGTVILGRRRRSIFRSIFTPIASDIPFRFIFLTIFYYTSTILSNYLDR